VTSKSNVLKTQRGNYLSDACNHDGGRLLAVCVGNGESRAEITEYLPTNHRSQAQLKVNNSLIIH